MPNFEALCHGSSSKGKVNAASAQRPRTPPSPPRSPSSQSVDRAHRSVHDRRSAPLHARGPSPSVHLMRSGPLQYSPAPLRSGALSAARSLSCGAMKSIECTGQTQHGESLVDRQRAHAQATRCGPGPASQPTNAILRATGAANSSVADLPFCESRGRAIAAAGLEPMRAGVLHTGQAGMFAAVPSSSRNATLRGGELAALQCLRLSTQVLVCCWRMQPLFC